MQKHPSQLLLLLALIAMFATVESAFAQGFGIIGGISSGSVPQSVSGGFGQSTGVSASLGFALGLSAETDGAVGFGSNLLFARRDLRYAPYGEGNRRGYVDVPLYFKLSVPIYSAAPFFLVGPQGSVAVGCNDACSAGQPTITYAAIAAVGTKFGTTSRFSVQARYVYGFTNERTGLAINPGGFFQPPDTFRTRSLLLLAALGF
jgi:hypothetical protein